MAIKRTVKTAPKKKPSVAKKSVIHTPARRKKR